MENGIKLMSHLPIWFVNHTNQEYNLFTFHAEVVVSFLRMFYILHLYHGITHWQFMCSLTWHTWQLIPVQAVCCIRIYLLEYSMSCKSCSIDLVSHVSIELEFCILSIYPLPITPACILIIISRSRMSWSLVLSLYFHRSCNISPIFPTYRWYILQWRAVKRMGHYCLTTVTLQEAVN